ncbi:hypothetical protein NTGHW29_740008 [Candidatus Nitrotoga sp. HW29]|nr:hypothetical protein NTGHW29_740008 [Candidatus Nitrotoga sp. HW29]
MANATEKASSTVHFYFAKWSKPDEHDISVLERVLKKIRLARPARNRCATHSRRY